MQNLLSVQLIVVRSKSSKILAIIILMQILNIFILKDVLTKFAHFRIVLNVLTQMFSAGISLKTIQEISKPIYPESTAKRCFIFVQVEI